MPPAKPSLDLLRSLTDEHVLRTLMDARRATRAELASRTGISKPTISESVRRLSEGGLVRDSGERTSGRGRVGSYYALADGAGCALVISIAPEGLVAEALDPYGNVIARSVHDVERPARPEQVKAALTAAVRRVRRTAGQPCRLAVVSAADPVDRATGRLVHLPDAPFLLGELSPVEALGALVDGPVLVDNDVNWAAQAEREARETGEADDFAYLHLGEGLGCAVISDGAVRRGHSGMAGEVAHLVTVGPGGRASRFTEVFADLGLRRTGSTAIDVDALLALVHSDQHRAAEVLDTLAEAVCGVLAALVALTDPEFVVIGGTWGPRPAVMAAISTHFQRFPRHVPVHPARLTTEPSLAGARHHALQELRSSIVDLAASRPS